MNKRGRLAMIDIDFRKIARLQAALKAVPEVVTEEIGRAVRDLILLVEGEAKKNCAVDTGKLRASITPVIESWPGASRSWPRADCQRLRGGASTS
jgi:hypothetical protein